MEMENMHFFSFVMDFYRLSSNKVLHSTSNQFLYVFYKNLLHFLNIKQQFSSMSWFLCLSCVLLGHYWEKNFKNFKNERMLRPYKWLFIEWGFKTSAHYAINDSVVNQIRYV